MASIYANLKNTRQFKASTGLSKEKFEELATTFAIWYEPREKVGYSKDPVLSDPNEALAFILFYFKTAVTFQVLGVCFGISDQAAHSYKNYIMPYLKKALQSQDALAHQIFETQADFDLAFEGVEDICIDGYELPIERSQDQETQKDCFSGKKNGIH